MGEKYFEPINKDNFSVQITNPEVMKRLNIETYEETIDRFKLGKSLKEMNLSFDLADPETRDYSAIQSFINDWGNLADCNKQDIQLSNSIRLSNQPEKLSRIVKKAIKATYRRNTKGKRLLKKINKHYHSYILKNCELVPSSNANVDDLMDLSFTVKYDYAEQV